MGGDTTTKSPLWGDLRDEGQAPEGVDTGGEEERKEVGGAIKSNSNKRNDGST